MARVYIDTNIFLDFYQSAADRIKVFDALAERASSLITTEQTINEFHRNREARLVSLIDKFEKSVSIAPYTTSLIQALPEFKAVVDARDGLKKKANAVVERLRAMLLSEGDDLVLGKYNSMLADGGEAVIIKTTSDLVAKAQRRKLLGQPPSSPDKHTIGDELIWESLLAGCREDLVIVSRDTTFRSHASVLRAEYRRQLNRDLILVTDKVSEALEKAGSASTVIKEEEKRLAESRAERSLTLCEKCGGRLEETGFEGSDGDEAWWLVCTGCGAEYFP
ncbi:DUF4935 domain-containing protein [Corallococcus coralloides]|nr:DUF4935 domain-containing protein [Corallococcus coralloides]